MAHTSQGKTAGTLSLLTIFNVQLCWDVIFIHHWAWSAYQHHQGEVGCPKVHPPAAICFRSWGPSDGHCSHLEGVHAAGRQAHMTWGWQRTRYYGTLNGAELLRGQGVDGCFAVQPSHAAPPRNFVVGQIGRLASQRNCKVPVASSHNKTGTGMRQQQPAETAQDTV